jgi:hypothetical protein
MHLSQIPQFLDLSAAAQQTFTALVAIGSWAMTAIFSVLEYAAPSWTIEKPSPDKR